MRRLLLGLTVALGLAVGAHAQIIVPYSFTAGTVIDPDQMNSNFTAVADACNRTGCTMTGLLKVIPGTSPAPGIANSTDPTTGIAIGTAGTIGFSLSGTQRALLNASGLTVFANNIINSSGKIPDLSSTYFTAISASNFTTGTVPVARLGSGSPSATTFLRGDSTWTGAGIQAPVTTAKSANYTAVANDVVLSTGTFTVTLPAASSNTNAVIDVKNVSSGVVTIGRTGADTIDGATTQSLSVQYQSYTFISDGTNWWIK